MKRHRRLCSLTLPKHPSLWQLHPVFRHIGTSLLISIDCSHGLLRALRIARGAQQHCPENSAAVHLDKHVDVSVGGDHDLNGRHYQLSGLAHCTRLPRRYRVRFLPSGHISVDDLVPEVRGPASNGGFLCCCISLGCVLRPTCLRDISHGRDREPSRVEVDL